MTRKVLASRSLRITFVSLIVFLGSTLRGKVPASRLMQHGKLRESRSVREQRDWLEDALESSDYSPALQETIRRKVACGEIKVESEADFLTLLEQTAETQKPD